MCPRRRTVGRIGRTPAWVSFPPYIARFFNRCDIPATCHAIWYLPQKNACDRSGRHRATTQLPRCATGSNSMDPIRNPLSADYRTPEMANQLFRRYKKLVELKFKNWHRVAQYAKHIGCSQKELHQVTLSDTGLSAKAFLMSRIVAEAEQLLANTPLSVAAISDELGFHEPTYFVKVFRRSVGVTPGQFRSQSEPS
jgi:AraC-like DNA-binding protein